MFFIRRPGNLWLSKIFGTCIAVVKRFNTLCLPPKSETMSKQALFTGLLCLHLFTAASQITLNVSPATIPSINGSYTSLTKSGGVFSALNGKAFLGNTITITVTGNVTDENGAVQLNGNGWTSVTMQPSGGVSHSLSGTHNGSLFVFNGADNVTINGLNAGGNALTFSNLAVNAAANTFTFTNDASNNTITNCTILGSGTSNTSGTIYFGVRTALVGTGNDNNTISNCNIGPAGVSLPVNAIFSSGTYTTQGTMNNANSISNNNIYDFFSPVQNSAGIYLHYGNHNWTINGNHIYQTATRTFTSNAGNVYAGIKLDAGYPSPSAAEGNNFIITNNRIGFASSSGTGVTTITGTGAGLQNKIRAMDLINVATSVASSIQGNTISGFNQTTSYSNTATTEGCFVAIMLGSSGTGRYDVGNTSGNTIGSLDGSSTIVINQSSVTASNARVVGIQDYTGSSNTISNNNIGAITIQGTGTTTGFSAIRVNTATGLSTTVTGNNIGGSVTAGAINNLQSGIYVCYMIDVALANATISNNNIQNINTNSTDAGYVSLTAITATGSTGVNTVSNNLIHSLTNNPGVSNAALYAIDLSLPATNNVIEKNRVHSLENSSNATAQVVGIFARAGRGTYQNNVVRLGISKSGGSITLGTPFYGIWNASSTADNRFYHNTVYIGGTGVISGSPTACMYGSVVGTFARYYQNNNLVNLRQPASGSALNVGLRYEGSVTTGITSNYNNIQTLGLNSYAGVFNSTIYNTLALWQSNTAMDAMSVDGDPLFVNANGNATSVDLNIQTGSICNNEGLRTSPVVADDMNGIARNNSAPVATPDIGAYELTRGTSPGTWIGVVDTDWTKTANWDNGVVPTSLVNVHIARGHKTAGGITDLPVIPSAAIASCNSINLLLPVSSVMVSGTATIRVAGNIANRGTLNIVSGTLELNGSTPQSIAGSRFYQHSINNLVIGNTVNLIKDSAPNDTLNITGSLSFSGSNKTFNVVSATNPTYGQLSLKSSSATTAYVADITNAGANTGNNINGNVTVERYIHTPRKWQLVSVPANTTQSVNAAWQEGQLPGVAGPSGYGTIITGPSGTGLDLTSHAYSMKWWNGTAYTNVNNTSSSIGTNKDRAYFIYIRGDRSITSSTGFNNTTLRVTGPLNQNNYIPSVTIPAGQQITVANPYAAPVDFTRIKAHSNIDDQFQVWDPKLQGLYTAGGFVSFSAVTVVPYQPVPATPGSYTAGVGNTRIESGQGFFVRKTSSAGSISFAETDKATGSRSVNRNPLEINSRSQFNTNLYALSGGSYLLVDGNAVVFDPAFKNLYDDNDVNKMSNGSDNFSVKKNTGPLLIIDARNELGAEDSINFNHQAPSYQQYRLLFYTNNFDTTVKAWLADKFTGTHTALNIADTTVYDFSITSNPASKAADRFKIIFKKQARASMRFVAVQAIRKADLSIGLDWTVQHAENISRYEIERSANGTAFTMLSSQDAIGTDSYTATDKLPLNAANYYRIKAWGRMGELVLSETVKVEYDNQIPAIVVAPNPVKNGRLNLRFIKQAPGEYVLELTNGIGQNMYRSKLVVDGHWWTRVVSLNNSFVPGTYLLTIRNAAGEIAYAAHIIIE